MASSPDGRTLATGDAIGTIKLWDFETLSLLYCIKSSEYEVRSLAFSGDVFRLYDIRDTKAKIWEPSALARKTVSEDSRISGSVTAPVPVTGRDTEVIEITHILAPPGAGCIFVGRDDGSVLAYDWTTSEVISKLYSHRWDVFVTNIAWSESRVASADASSKTEFYSLKRTDSGQQAVDTKVFEIKLIGPIQNLVLHPTLPLLLISQARYATLIEINSKAEYALPVDENEEYTTWQWLNLSNTELLLGSRGTCIDIYTVDQCVSGAKPVTWQLMRNGLPIIQSMSFDAHGQYVAVLLTTASSGEANTMKLLVYRAPGLSKTDQGENQVLTTDDLIIVIWNHEINKFFGFCEGRIVFLDHKLWFHSIDLSKAAAGASVDSLWERHFFVPREFIGSNDGIDGVATGGGTIDFPKEGELAIVRNALELAFTGVESDDHRTLRRHITGMGIAGK